MLNVPTSQEAAKASEKARDEEAKRLKVGVNKATISQFKILPELIEELEKKGHTIIKDGFLTTIKW